MSQEEVRNKIIKVQNQLDKDGLYFSYSSLVNEVNHLMGAYGNYLGIAKVKNRDYSDEINVYDVGVEDVFKAFIKSQNNTTISKQLVGLLIKRISVFLSFLHEVNFAPKEEVPKKIYEKLLEENNANRKVIKILSKVKGMPELNELLEKSCEIGIEINESWVLAICSINLIEAGVNKKLEELKEPTDGNFEKKYKRLVSRVKVKENRTIQHMLPLALYKGIRNKLDHASHSNRVTWEEAKKISNLVMDILNELFTNHK